MVRAQLQFTEIQLRKLRIRARREGISLAELVRRFVDECLERPSSEDRKSLYAKASELVGAFSDRDQATDVAEDHDAYLAKAFEK